MKKMVKKTLISAFALSIALNSIHLSMTAEATGDIIDLVSANVALDDSISLRFYVTKESVDAANTQSVTLTGPNDTITYTSYEKKGDKYVFSYPLYATQLGEKVSIQFNGNDKAIEIDAATEDPYIYSYTVYDYCDYITDNSEYDNRTKNAVKSLRNLGLSADNYFKNSANSISFLDSEYNLDKYAPQSTADVKFSLVLDSKFAARAYIPGLPLNVNSTYSEYLDEPVYTSVEGKDGKNCFEATGIRPVDLDKNIYIIYNDIETFFTPLAFCYRALSNKSEKSSEIAKAVYEYYKYVSEYYNHYLAKNNARIYNRGNNEYGISDYGPFYFECADGMTWSELVSQVDDETLLSEDNDYIYVGTKKLELYNGNDDSLVSPQDMVNKNIDYYVLDFIMYPGE